MIEEAEHVPRRLVPDATLQLILAGISNGQPLLAACENAGINRSSFYRWLETDPQLVHDYAQAVAAQVHSRFTK